MNQQPIDPQDSPVVEDVPTPAEPSWPAPAADTVVPAEEPVVPAAEPIVKTPQASGAPDPQAPAQWPTAGYAAAPADAYAPAAYPAYAAPAVAPTQTSSNAIIAIILAVLSWAVCPIIPAVISLVFASMATKEIEASGGRIQGQGLVTASKIVSWINIGLWAAVVVVGGFMVVLIAIAGGFSSNAG